MVLEELDVPFTSVEVFRAPACWTGRDESEESFSKLRYTACTNENVKDFEKLGSVRALESHISGSGRIKVFIVITMYNEPDSELETTLQGVANNIDTFVRRRGMSWRQVLVAVIIDGRAKANPSVMQFSQSLGIYDPELIRTHVDGRRVYMHLFETNLVLQKRDKFKASFHEPMQIMFCLKEYNGGKLSSHLWYFRAFCPAVNPLYAVLLDVGTMPRPEAIVRLVLAMDDDQQCGGCCGEIAVMKPQYLNLLVAAQLFEYKISNVMDKAMESMFGYITVLPGAFSAYRWTTISSDLGEGDVLQKYFLSLQAYRMTPFKANMYLAEDRILCWEIVAMKSCSWTLKYVSDAVAETDVPKTLNELIKQRRRWLNGSFFASLYTLQHTGMLLQSSHSFIRKFFFFIQIAVMTILTSVAWFLLGTFYLSFLLLVKGSFPDSPVVPFVFGIIYLLMLIVQFLCALGNRPDKVIVFYLATHSVISGMLLVVMIMSFVSALQEAIAMPDIVEAVSAPTVQFSLFVSIIITLGSMGICAAVHGELLTIVRCIGQYFCLLPLFVNTFSIYAFCNTHDISWGTKEASAAPASSAPAHGTNRATSHVGYVPDAPPDGALDPVVLAHLKHVKIEEKRRRDKTQSSEKENDPEFFKAFRTKMVTAWLTVNWVFVAVVINFESSSSIFATVLIRFVFFTLGYRMLGSLLYAVFKKRTRVNIITPARSGQRNINRPTRDVGPIQLTLKHTVNPTQLHVATTKSMITIPVEAQPGESV